VLQCVAVRCSVLHISIVEEGTSKSCSVLQCAAVCCSVLRCVAVCCTFLLLRRACQELRCVEVCCSVLRCVAGCYRVLRMSVVEEGKSKS